MATDAKELRVADLMATTFATIDKGGGVYNTTPTIVNGEVPGDTTPQGAEPTVFLVPVDSDARDEDADSSNHVIAVGVQIYIVSTLDDAAAAIRQAWNTVADIKRAFFAAEDAFYSAFRYGHEVGRFYLEPEMLKRGQIVIVGVLTAIVQQPHDDT